MIYILHGENLPAIRNFILKLQQENNTGSKKELVIGDTSPSEVEEFVTGVDMFGDTIMIVLDVTKMGRTNVNKYIEVLKGAPEDLIVVVFAGKVLPKTNTFVKNAQTLGARVMSFKQLAQSSVFKFVDHVFAGNRDASYKELRRLVLAGDDPIYIFSMLTYGLRNIVYAKFDSEAFDKLSPFVKSKAKFQAQRFTTSSVKDLHNVFYTLDRDAKQGLVSLEMLPVYALEKVLTYI